MFDRNGGLGSLVLLLILSGMLDGFGDGDDVMPLLLLLILLGGGLGRSATTADKES